MNIIKRIIKILTFNRSRNKRHEEVFEYMLQEHLGNMFLVECHLQFGLYEQFPEMLEQFIADTEGLGINGTVWAERCD